MTAHLKRRIERSGGKMLLYLSRAALLQMLLLSILFLGAGAAGLGSTSIDATDIVGLALGGIALIVSIAGWLSSRPILVISKLGISSPFLNQYETRKWDEIAGIRVGAMYMQKSVSIYLWKDPKNPNIGAKLWLHIPSGVLPVRAKKLVPELLAFRPSDGTSG